MPQRAEPTGSAQHSAEGSAAGDDQDLLISDFDGGLERLAHTDCRSVVKLFRVRWDGILSCSDIPFDGVMGMFCVTSTRKRFGILLARTAKVVTSNGATAQSSST